MPDSPIIHKHTSSAKGALINAYLVEAENGVVAGRQPAQPIDLHTEALRNG